MIGGMRRSLAPANRIQAGVVFLGAPAAMASFSVPAPGTWCLTVAFLSPGGEACSTHHTITLPVTAASEATK
jgi:hypothetical protein